MLMEQVFLMTAAYHSVNGIEKQPFAWKLNHNKTVIDFFHDSFNVQHIDNSKMILYKELIDVGGNIQKLLFIFRHRPGLTHLFW